MNFLVSRTKLRLELTLTEFVWLVGDVKLDITLDPQKQSTLAKADVLPPYWTTSQRQQNFVSYTNESSFGGLFSWWTVWDTWWTSQLFGLAATPGGQPSLRWKKLIKYMLSFFLCLEFVPYRSCNVQANYLERGDPSVLSVCNFSAGGFEKAVNWNFLHP